MFIAALMLFGLVGCGGGAAMTALMVLEGLASTAEIADKVLDIDISLTQQHPGKTPIAKALAQM